MTNNTRKTIPVAELAHKLQHAISQNTISEDERRSLVWALETVLHDSGNYRGFQFDTRNDGTEAGGPNYYRRTYYLPKVR